MLKRVQAGVLEVAYEESSPAGGAASERHERFFTAAYERRVIPAVGHNLPQEAPRELSAAVASLTRQSAR